MAIFVSWILVAFGQAAWLWFLGPFVAAGGFALFWLTTLRQPSAKTRFWWGFFWYGSIQIFQLSWSISHPYSYIYALLLLTSSIYAAQFGWITSFVTLERLRHWPSMVGIASLWVFNEWVRLFFLLELPWNAVGLSFATTSSGAQGASVVGVYGLTFLVILTNLAALRAYLLPKRSSIGSYLFLFAIPYLFGWGHLFFHEKKLSSSQDPLRYLLVQTAFPVEESMAFPSVQAMTDFVTEEWRQILTDLAHQKEKKVDFVVLPEYVVPFSVYSPVYRHSIVQMAFAIAFGEEALAKLPKLNKHFAYQQDTPYEKGVWMVNNAYWIQGIANLFDADVIAGLEDHDVDVAGEVTYYSAGLLFHPHRLSTQRYEKRVLVPMGEYIPFEWCRNLCRKYGIAGSFTPGTEGKALQGCIPVGISICYEETFGHLMRDNRLKGAEVLVNLTNDGWYPNSKLPWQHLEHSRLRTVEAGIPLVRACNTGVTGAVDCLGRNISYLADDHGDVEKLHGALYVEVPRYTYTTVYTYTGDYMILGICGLGLLGWIGRARKIED